MSSSRRVLLSAFLIALALAPTYVLSQDPKPSAYHLKIDASDLATSDNFSGTVLVNFTLTNFPTFLLVNSENLTLNENSIIMMRKHPRKPQWDPVNFKSLRMDSLLLNISFGEPQRNGEYSLYVEYTGYYQTSMAGFAKIGYHVKNELKYMGVTGLQPANARKVFPCFDSPGYRAQFTLELTVDSSHRAITSVRHSSLHNVSETKKAFLFDKYPTMPVNKLAWAVLDQTSYTRRELNLTSTGTTIHTRAPHLYYGQTSWANNLTAELMESVGNYTAFGYDQAVDGNSNIIEQIVLPEFFIGTSEGFGFTSFSEESLLVSLNNSSTRHIQNVGLTLARGAVQQWFGSIVTADSWKNMWFMKGLDEYLKYIVIENVTHMKEWNLQDQAVIELTQQALALDSNSHALTVDFDDETELITAASDNLTKYKGGAIIRMLADLFGKLFQEVISFFFMDSKNDGFVTPEIFWDNLYGEADGIDLAQQTVATVMDKWINSPGYPVLTVTSNSSHFKISQNDNSSWYVPITYSLQGSPQVNRVWLKPASSVSIPVSSSKWILLNINQTGYYRVNYTASLREVLMKQLTADLTQLPPLNRAQLIDDIFSIDPAAALEFTGFLRSENDYFPWATALRHYEALINSVTGHSSYYLLQDYALGLMKGIISRVEHSGINQLSHIDKLKRSLVLEKACLFGHSNCILRAVTNLGAWMSKTYYDRDLSPALICAGVRNSSSDVWRSVWSMYQYSVFPSVRLELLKSLTCTHNQDLLYEFLNNITATREPAVSIKDKTILLEALSSKPFGANVLFNWLLNKLKSQANYPTTPVMVQTTQATQATQTAETSKVNSLSSNQTTDETKPARLTSDTIPGEQPTINLTESDVKNILNMVLPMLTSMEEGTKLDSLIALGNVTGLSNHTLEVMRNATQRIYWQAERATRLNVELARWLESEAITSTSSSAGPTRTSSQTPGPEETTASPSSTSSLDSSLSNFIVLLLAVTSIYQGL